MRTCDICNKKMIEGFCVQDTEYFCSDDCLHSTYSPEEYEELYNDDHAYWTSWDGE